MSTLIAIVGPTGVGKTHLATVLGLEACLSGKSVLFTNIPNLVIELKESMSANQLNFYKRPFGKYDLVILDELGYVSLSDNDVDLILKHLCKLPNGLFEMRYSIDNTYQSFDC